MSNFNYASLTATDTQAAAASATATATGIKNKQLQVVGFSGCSSDQNFKIELIFGTTVMITLHTLANSMGGHFFDETGPMAAEGETITVVTTPDAVGQADANLIYKIHN